MGDREMRIVFSSGITDWSEKNASFDSGVLRVAYTGKNRNNSFISKKVFEKCIESIYNCPIVCRYDRETGEIGAHDVELVEGQDGGLRLVNVTQPVGVVPESAKYWWEEIEDDSGLHEYLCVEVLLWKRQEAYQKIKEDGVTEESMEITVKEGKMVDGVYVIDLFEFTAFCLLGTAEPCFESASLEVFSCNDFKQQLAEMMKDLKETYELAQSPQGVGIQENDLEGGEGTLNQDSERIALAQEYGLDVEQLDFSLDDFSLDELRDKFEEMRQERYALESQIREELRDSIEAEKIERGEGDWRYMVSKYWFFDYDKDLSEVYGQSSEDYNIYGFSYSMDGDHVVIDWESRKRMKIALVEYDEGTQESILDRVFSCLETIYQESRKELSDKYQEAFNKAESMEGELEELRQFKADTESAAAQEERESIFANFEDLNGVEAFEALRENAAEYSMEALEEKCYAIRGRQGVQAKFSAAEKAPKLPIEKRGNAPKGPYNGVFAEFGFEPPENLK